jgi:protein-tyrosine phosphatase
LQINGLPIVGAVSIVLAGCAPVAESRIAEAQVERAGPNGYRLTWSGTAEGSPVDVYIADRPDAPRDALRLVADDDTDGRAVVSAQSGNRPYFYVATDDGGGVWTAERVLPLEGGRNFRDLGGYPAADGKRVRWGKVYRSGTMSGLTPADYDYLADLGIKAVCDFRTAGERKAEPNKWASDRKIAYWARDYDMGFGELGKLLSSKGVTPDQVKATMIEGYRRTPYEQAPGYREMFKRLATGEIPLAFNCSAGKDRAGVAAALLLSALGVPRDVVVADYALSEKVVDFRKEVTGRDNSAFSALAQLPPEVLAPLMRSDPDYIRATFAEIERRHGSVERYLTEMLGVTEADLRAIRQQLLV